ncbi:nucleoside-diphosphate kinase [Candidatus Nesciobacter abundans]|uniref:Nucleoside diphosphate kinase n=1 Tax=Candidatus Nesciobacter abundans TaxID=2601668 RepID=A0A5C0UIH5_9PROT|nr:nucleoside-diphosphate kinase [Candidatus Nesciobacter abundans]QEK39313.1 nucleoside-diphosphate kinase [Candidatus Nesciobacter abundans]
MYQKTLSIIKPDAVKKKAIGNIINIFETNGFTISDIKMLKLSMEEAREFYKEHAARPFFNGLCEFMCSGPIVAMCLEGEGAILKNREVMGATNPSEAEAGTIRKMYGDSIDNNAVHGSDSTESAERELNFFFSN